MTELTPAQIAGEMSRLLATDNTTPLETLKERAIANLSAFTPTFTALDKARLADAALENALARRLLKENARLLKENAALKKTLQQMGVPKCQH